jgi:hypothetical protein
VRVGREDRGELFGIAAVDPAAIERKRFGDGEPVSDFGYVHAGQLIAKRQAPQLADALVICVVASLVAENRCPLFGAIL